MFALVEDRRIEHVREELLLLGEIFLKARDDVTTHHHMNIREGLLDHFAKRHACEQLHLGPDGNPDNVRHLLRHRRHDQLIAEVPIDVDLLIVQTGQHFLRYAGAIAQIAFHRIEDE